MSVVEHVAVALCEYMDRDWDKAPNLVRDRWMRAARVALQAADEARRDDRIAAHIEGAREALDGLARAERVRQRGGHYPQCQHVIDTAIAYRDEHYPKETDR